MDELQRQFLMQEWLSLRHEIELHIWQLMITVWIVLVVMLGCVFASRFDRLRETIVLAVIFGAFAPYMIARSDLLMHRVGGAAAQIEQKLGVQGWESYYKPRLTWGRWLLLPLDILAVAPIIFLFWYSNRQMWLMYQNQMWWTAAWATFLVGVVFIILANALADH